MGGSKMSKSKGNLESPEHIVATVGADALRLAILQVKPPADDVDWEDFQLDGCSRFLNRVWRVAVPESDLIGDTRTGDLTAADTDIDRAMHALIERVTNDYERWSYNTAVAALMEFTNDLYRYVQAEEGPHAEVLAAAVDALLLVMCPAVPHIAAELYELRGDGDIHAQSWPTFDPTKLVVTTETMIVQVNGKLRDRIEVAVDISDSDAEAAAMASEAVQRHLNGGDPRKVIVRAPKLVNIVA